MKIYGIEELNQKNLGVHLIDAHKTEWKNGEIFNLYQDNPHPFSTMFFVLSELSCIYRELNEKKEVKTELTLKTGDILYVPEGILYRADFSVPLDTQDSFTRTINFNLFQENGERVLLSDRFFRFQNSVSSDILTDVEAIYNGLQTTGKSNTLRLSELFFSLLHKTVRQEEQISRAAELKKAVQVLTEEWNQNERMKRYADISGRNITAFYLDFHQYTGFTPVEYRNNIRLKAAASELLNTSLSVKEIARKVGIEDEYYFSRLFKEHIGVSPKFYRKKPG